MSILNWDEVLHEIQLKAAVLAPVLLGGNERQQFDNAEHTTASICSNGHPPVGHVIDEMLLEHEAPPLDDVQQSLLERLGIHAEPAVEDLDAFNLFSLLVDLLVRVDLSNNGIYLAFEHLYLENGARKTGTGQIQC